jgi:non-specific serine/threonine protein kinase
LDDRRTSAAGSRRPGQSSLPVQLTTFVGRQVERSEVRRLLNGARLLTLTGPGGVGKTRLALEVAAGLAATCPEGVHLVELAALADGTLVPQAVASALGVHEVPGRPLRDTLAAALGARRLLLILDNCEHLVAACAELADRLLRECPALHILATSREPLGVPGETTWPVPPLPVPDPCVALGTDEIAASEAVRLFVDRARLAQPSFALRDRNAQVVAEICRRLDGIPLAIELAAARLRSLGIVEIAERLDDRFRFLTTDLRTIVPRQQTLRATVDWSYELLDEPERRMLRALAVFAGGFTLDAAESVCDRGASGEWRGTGGTCLPSPLAPHPSPLDALGRLVDRSLVLADSQQGRARYRLLETIRQYGLERLRERGEEPALRARHCDWFLALAERAGPALRGPEQAAWVERLELEHDNLRAALKWAVEAGDAERGLRLAGALWRFWSYRGYLIEGRRWLDAVLALTSTQTAPSVVLAEVLFAAGRLTHQQGEYADAHRRFQAALSTSEQSGHAAGIVGALTQLGHLALNRDEYDAAHEQYARALDHRHAVGDSGEVVVALASLAFVNHLQGQYDEARAL